MSSEQEDAIVGRAWREWAECKRTLAAHQAEANRTAKDMLKVAEAMSHATSQSDPGDPFTPFLLNEHLSRIPSAEKIREIADGIKEQLSRRVSLRVQLKNMTGEYPE